MARNILDLIVDPFNFEAHLEEQLGFEINTPFETTQEWLGNIGDALTGGDYAFFLAPNPFESDPAFIGSSWMHDYVQMRTVELFDVPEYADPDPSSPTYARGRPVNTYSNEIPVNIVCGRVKMAGNIIYQGGTRADLDFFVSIGEGTVQSITDIRLDDVPITDLPGARAEVYLGTSTQDPDSRFTVTTHQDLSSTLEIWDFEAHTATPEPLPFAQTTFTVLNDSAIVYLTIQAYMPWISDDRKYLTVKVEYKASSSEDWIDGGDYKMALGKRQTGILTGRFPMKPGSNAKSAAIPFDHGYTEGGPHLLAIHSSGPKYAEIQNIDVEYFAAADYDLRLTFQSVDSGGGIDTSTAWLKLYAIDVEEQHGAQAFRNTAYIAITVPSSALTSSKPNITSLVEGIDQVKLWTGSEWTNGYTTNPIWHIRNLLTSTRQGIGLAEVRINDERLKTEAAYCDGLVNGIKRFEYNRVIDNRKSAGDWIRELLIHCRGRMWRDAGIIQIEIGKAKASTGEIDIDVMVEGSFEFWHESTDDAPDSLTCTYIDPADDFEHRQFVLGQHTAEGKNASMTLLGCNEKSQAERVSFYAFNKATRTARCKFSTILATMAIEVGDVRDIFHPVGPLGYDITDPNNPVKLESGVAFIIDSYSDSDADVRTYQCRQYDPAIFSDDPAISDPLSATSPVANPLRVPEPAEDVRVVFLGDLTGDGVWNPEVVASWTHPNTMGIMGFEIYQSKTDGEEWELVSYQGGASSHRWQVTVFSGTLQIKIIPVGIAKKGTFAAATAASVVVALDPAAPVAPADLVNVFGQSIVWTWTRNTETDFSHYLLSFDDFASTLTYYIGQPEGYYPDGWFGGTGEIPENDSRVCRHEITAPTLRGYTLSIKGVDHTGNMSDASSSEATLPAPAAPNTAHLIVEKSQNYAQLWVEGHTYSTSHAGFQFRWSTDEATWTNVNTQPSPLGNIVVLHSKFTESTLDIYIQYMEWDVVGASGNWSDSKPIQLVLSTSEYTELPEGRWWAAEEYATNDEQWQEGSTETLSRKIKTASMLVQFWNRVYNPGTQPDDPIVGWSPVPTRVTASVSGRNVDVAEKIGVISSTAFQVTSNRNYRFIVSGRVSATGDTQKVSIRVYKGNASGEKGTEIGAYACDLSVAGPARTWAALSTTCDFWSGQLNTNYQRFECFVVGHDTPPTEVPEGAGPGAGLDFAFKLPPDASWVKFVLDAGTQTARWFGPSVADAEGGVILAHRVNAVTVSSVASDTGILTVDSTGRIESSNFSAGSAGFRVQGNGNAEFSDVSIRGTGTIDGTPIATVATLTDKTTADIDWDIGSGGDYSTLQAAVDALPRNIYHDVYLRLVTGAYPAATVTLRDFVGPGNIIIGSVTADKADVDLYGDSHDIFIVYDCSVRIKISNLTLIADEFLSCILVDNSKLWVEDCGFGCANTGSSTTGIKAFNFSFVNSRNNVDSTLGDDPVDVGHSAFGSMIFYDDAFGTTANSQSVGFITQGVINPT